MEKKDKKERKERLFNSEYNKAIIDLIRRKK